MSAINTNGLNVNYPVAGVNNNSQGFRDNFSIIKTNLDASATEITDLQSKVIVKSALNDINLNNDMANTLISNALVRGFRASTYNLGNNISGTQVINVNQGDVQYGTIAGNTTIQFGGWGPDRTQSNVQVILTVADTAVNSTITLPITITDPLGLPQQGMGLTTRVLENYQSAPPFDGSSPPAKVSYTNEVTIPYGVSQLHYEFSSLNCGTTIDVNEVNRSKVSAQVALRTLASLDAGKGQVGDRIGTVCMNSDGYYLCTADYDSANPDAVIWQQAASSFMGSGPASNVAYANTAGDITSNAQPNITSVGTLSSLSVFGNIKSGNANLGNAATANFFIGSGNNLSNIQAANIVGTVANANYAAFAGNITINAQPNITSFGTLTGLSTTGNVGFGTGAPTARLAIVGTAYSLNQNLADASTISWDTTLGQVATFTFVLSNRTMAAPTNLRDGAFYALAVYQNAGNNTLIWNSVFKWSAGTAPTLSTASGAKDFFVFRSDGTNLYEQGRSQGVA